MDATTSLLPNVARMDSKQLSHLYHLIFTTDVSSEIVKESIEAVCGRGVEIARDTQITPVLQEVINRQVLEENAYWDFRAMVVNERQTLSPADTLLFMRVLHGDNFSTAHWNKFMDSRLDRGADVSWAEVKPWVCRIPDERDLLDNGYKEVESEVQQEESRRNEESLRRYTDSNKRKHAKEMFLHTQKVKKQAQNKVNLWEQEGIAAFLADEPEGHYIDASKWMNKDRVVTTDVLDLLEEKYTRLRQKLLTLMATRFSGETTWEILSDRDRHELVEEMVMEERRLRLSGVLPAQSRDLLGATFTSDENFRSIAALMGEVYERQKEGSQSNQVVVGEDYWRKMAEVQDTFGQYLIDLMSRYEQELALYKSNLRCEKERKTRNEVIYCQLQRQLLVIDSREKFEMAALAVGVTERTSKNSHREVDRKRQEALASVQLSSHVDARGSKHAIASASMTTSELNSLGDRELYLLIIKQIQTKHNAESRRMGSLLHQRSSRSQKSAPTTLMKDEVIRQLTVLSNQRATWREANDKYKEMQKDDHRRILQNALAIYYESEARQAFPDYKTHAKMNAGILALLYKKQGEEFDKLIDELSRKQKMGLIEVLKREEQDTVHEHCNNIAALLFGSVESGEVDKLYVEQLGLKYLGYRHQIVQYSLSKKFGDSWYSRPVEDQQRHIAKLAITLKELLDQGKVDEMDAAVAETTQHISMYQCLGENRLQFEKRISSGQPNGDETVPSEPGVFGSLSSRYFSEYAAVLEAAHKAGDTEPRVLLALLKAETFIVEQSNDMRIALFLTGLIERVGGVLGKRHSADLIRIGNLAKCLVANHRLVWRMQGKHPKVNSDVYCNNTSSPTQWLEGLLKELLCKHWDERDTLLKIVLDEGLRELREVADCQSKEDQHRRLVALQNMQRWLDFDSPDARDENIAILEEAAAIQMCMVCETLVKANQPADVDSIAVVLTEKLLGKQEKELAYLLKEIKTMGVEDMMRMHGEQTEARQTDRCKNVAKVLTSYTGIWTDARIISEVDTKYSMLEKLMLESRLRLSEPQWDTMDSTRKDQLLAELKAQTERHRVAGNEEALRSLYAPLFPDDQKFFSLFGENSFEFAHKIVDFQNVDNLPNDIYSVAEEIVPVVDPVAALRLRKDEEKQAYQNLLRGMYGVFLGDQGRAAEVIKLRHHQSMIKSSSDFANIALQLGFKERSQLVTYLTKGSGDHKMLCTGDWERIVAVSTKAIEDGDVTMEDISAISGASSAASKLFIDLLHTYIMRQKQERQQLAKLIAALSESVQIAAALLPKDEKLLQLPLLRLRFKNKDAWPEESVNIACAMKAELWKNSRDGVAPINAILAELEERQLFELSNLIHTIADKSVKDLAELRDSFNKDICPCVYMALTDMSHFYQACADRIPQAIENKYETLRDKLLMSALMIQKGEAAWKQTSEADRQQALQDLKWKERQLNEQGSQHEAVEVIKRCLGNEQIYRRFLTDDNLTGVDVLEYITVKRQQELEEVMAGLAACETEELRERREQQELMRIQRGKRRLWREGQFGAAAILLKMLGRKEWSETEAREMQVALARERLADRKNAARDKTREEDALLPETGNVITIMEVVLHEMDLKHMEERDALLTLMEENAGSPHYQQSLASDQSHLESRLTDLSEERRRMRDSAIFDSKEQNALLQEGVCHKLRLRVLSLAEDGEDNSETEAAVTLLADLQQLQEQEMFGLYSTLQHKSVNSLRELRGSQEKARNKCWYDHLATAVLTAATITEALNPEQELITVLGQKYDALKDKLILEGLMNQVSEAEWQALSQKQRQQKLRDFKLQEKKLREDGKLDEAKQLMSDLLDADQVKTGKRKNGIDRIKADQERLLKEKRDALKKKLKTNPEDSEKLEEELNKVEEKLMKKSVLDNLSYEYEDEKERLLALLHSQQDDAMAERLKQLEMAKLRRQKRILQKEGELDEASALIHLSQKNEENRLAGLSSDKQLQMELARRRLEVRRAKAGTTEAEIPSTPTALAGVQDRVLEVLASKHSIERDILINYFMVVEEEDSLEHVLHISNVKLRKALQDLENQCKGLQTVCQTQTGNCAKEKSDLVKLLNKAFLYHLTVLLRASYGEDGSVYTLERVRETCTSLLASLQESQDSEAASTSELMINEEDSVLEKLLDAYNISIDKGQYNNLISSLFAILDDEHKWTAQQVDLDEKFEAQKQELLDAQNRGEDVITKDGHEVEVEALLKQLEAEHSAQKAAVAKQMERQNEMMLERRRAKKQARFAEDVSVAKRLLEEATANDLSHKNAHEQEQGRQGDLMSERLAKRKAERNRREAQEKKEELERFVRPKTVKDAFGNVINYMPPMMALRRERTVVEVSDEQKDKEWQKLVKETHRAELTRSQEQRRQEEMVRARRQQKQLRRHSEVEAIFSIGEKQKTMFERSNREDREQQVSKMKERIARIKNEKTMMAKPTRKSTSFEHLVDTSKGGSKDEQMKALAANLQKRFDDESQGVREGRASLAIGKEGAAETEQPTRILSLEEKQRILKERRLAKRKNKEAAAADPPPAE